MIGYMINEKTTRLILKISLWLKGLLAIAETFGGLAFYFISQGHIRDLVYFLTSDELAEDPKDFISNQLVASSHSLTTGGQHFIALYLLTHGLVKIAVITSLLKDRLWAYPTAIAVFTAFVTYQSYRFYFTHSAWLLLLTLFDVIIIWLVAQEYYFIKKRRSA
jgi:uncharacterized membrane protein